MNFEKDKTVAGRDFLFSLFFFPHQRALISRKPNNDDLIYVIMNDNQKYVFSPYRAHGRHSKQCVTHTLAHVVYTFRNFGRFVRHKSNNNKLQTHTPWWRRAESRPGVFVKKYKPMVGPRFAQSPEYIL